MFLLFLGSYQVWDLSIGSLFLLSGLLGTLPLIWGNLTYWAQLLLLIVTTVFLIYAANYSENFEDKSIFIFKSSERVSSVLYLISTISFGSVIVFTVNIINNPVEKYPTKIKSLKLEKNNLISGKLSGIKGQYLIFDGGEVFNVRSHEGYIVDFNTSK